MISRVHPSLVPLRKQPWERDVIRQKARLLREGQIEPILLTPNGYVDRDWFVYGEAQVQAALELGWETILVTTSSRDD